MCSCCVFIVKAIRRRGGQPRPAPMQGRPPMVRPQPRPPTRGQLTAARASPQGRPASLAGAAAHKGGAYVHDRLQPARRGDSRPRAHPLAAWRPQGAAVSRDDDVGRKGGRPLAGWILAVARAAVACARAATTTAATQMGQEGLGHSFEKRMILPL
ncbi:hypothetical protein BHM03_00047254 [Ensete ventricosum]|nr:hypothetical protein BHM03_00047254 [Ensete ventricosum]